METAIRLLVDALLVLGFGVQHSILATLRVKRAVNNRVGMKPLGWRSVESLSNIVYVLAATAFWQRTDVTIWEIHGLASYAIYAVLAVSWGWYWYLHLVEYDCGLAFGSTTLVAQRAVTEQPQLENWTVGSRRWIRFPVHTAFFGMFFALPHMTADLLLLAIVLNAYNVYGSILYDIRLKTTIPGIWDPYVEKTGLIWPPVYRNVDGARNIQWSKPVHWRRPIIHLPGLFVGVLIGLFYYTVLGSSPWGPVDMATALGCAVIAAVVGGLVLGRLLKPHHENWGQRQTDLSTTVALASAVGVATWIILSVAIDGAAPTFGTYLSMWFTVQYLGHVSAYLAAPSKWKTVEMTDAAKDRPIAATDSQRV